MLVIAPSTKEQIVLAAERLLAERGLYGVSLRQIAEADKGNDSAVQYHSDPPGLAWPVHL